MSIQIKLRRGTHYGWSSANIVLASGEPGFELDTGKLKVGDGVTAWNDLGYISVPQSGLMQYWYNSSIAGTGIALTLYNNETIQVSTTSGIPANYISGLNEAIDDRIGSGLFVAGTGISLIYDDNSESFTVSTTGVSFVGHSHTSSDITNFNSAVSGLLPVKNITASSGINVIATTGNFTISVSGLNSSYISDFNEAVDDRIGSGLFTAGTGINFIYNDSSNAFTISTTGVSFVGHTHISSDITNFSSSVSGLLPSVSGSGYVSAVFDSNQYIISVSGLQPSGNYSVVGHTHLSSEITDFNTSVSGLLPVKNIISGSGIGVSAVSGSFTVSVSGLTSSFISDFNEAVDDRIGSGLLVAGAGIGISYNDPGNSLTVDVLSAPKIITRVFNKTGSPIPKLRAVYINGGQGDQPTVALAIATGDATSSKTYGITNESIGNMSDGEVVVLGALSGVNTDPAHGGIAGGANGVTLYLSPTVSGEVTTTKPYAPDHIVALGTIVRTHQNEGVIEVRIQNGYELEELHNVATTGATSGQFLQYNGTGLWIPSSSGNFTTLQLNGTTVSVSGHTHTASQITDFDEAVDDRIGSGLFVAGTGVNLTYSDSGNSFTVSVSGLINNPTNNRILTSRDTTTTGIDAESNLTFDGTILSISGSLNVSTTGDINILKINSLYHNNLSIATGVADSSLLITIVDPTGTPSTQVISGSGLRNSLLNQPAVLRFRQGTNAERLLITPASGEPIWTTDTQQFYIGDGSTVGGDFMGPSPYARSSGTQSITALNTGCVASGNYSSVLGGQSNTIKDTANTNCLIGGGSSNSIYGNFCNDSTICGGNSNSIRYTGSNYTYYGFIGGGISNIISGSSYSSIVGGQGNSINENDQRYHTIGGGYSNYIDSQGYPASTIAGGYNNTITGDYSGGSAIGGGHLNTIGVGNTGGYFSTIGGGYGNKITGINYCTIPGGYFAKATRYGELSHAAGRFSNEGDAQHSTLIARKTTTTNTANQVLFLDDSSARLTIPAKTTWTFEVKLSAYNDTDSAGAGWIFRGAIRRNASNGTALIGTIITENWQDSAMSSTNASVVADDANEALEIRVTGIASKNIRWVAVVDISQVSYGTP